jgi:hypothetical protein
MIDILARGRCSCDGESLRAAPKASSLSANPAPTYYKLLNATGKTVRALERGHPKTILEASG